MTDSKQPGDAGSEISGDSSETTQCAACGQIVATQSFGGGDTGFPFRVITVSHQTDMGEKCPGCVVSFDAPY